MGYGISEEMFYFVKAKWQHRKQGVAGSTHGLQSSLLVRSHDGAVFPLEHWAAPPLSHLLLQPGPHLQVGLRGWRIQTPL